jgi:hypothetical protein
VIHFCQRPDTRLDRGSGDGAPSYKSCRSRLRPATFLAVSRVIDFCSCRVGIAHRHWPRRLASVGDAHPTMAYSAPRRVYTAGSSRPRRAERLSACKVDDSVGTFRHHVRLSERLCRMLCRDECTQSTLKGPTTAFSNGCQSRSSSALRAFNSSASLRICSSSTAMRRSRWRSLPTAGAVPAPLSEPVLAPPSRAEAFSAAFF